MPVVYLKWITRDMVRAEPAARFVFGDNCERVGLGGQAGAMRGEPNAIGVATKWAPGGSDRDYFSDADPTCLDPVNADIDRVQAPLEAGMTVYVPFDGLGTGLSELPNRAPKILEHIINRFAAMPGQPCPWRL